MDFRFQIHHLFPHELFDDLDRVAALNAIFAGAANPLLLDMAGNKIALFTNEDTAAAIRNGTLGSLGSNFGGSPHSDNHPGYNKFLIDQVDNVLRSTELTNSEKQTALLRSASVRLRSGKGARPRRQWNKARHRGPP